MMIVSLLHIIYSIQASSKVNDTSSICKEENATALQGLRNGTMCTSGDAYKHPIIYYNYYAMYHAWFLTERTCNSYVRGMCMNVCAWILSG